MNNPKISIVVPVYNAECYLEDCLSSLVNQTLDSFEVIVVDDASLDSSLAIAESFKSKYPDIVRVIQIDENHGQGFCRNIGMQRCIGQYIGFVDADDIVRPDMFSRMYEVAIENNSDCCSCGMVSFHMENGTIRFRNDLVLPPIEHDRGTQMRAPQVSPPMHIWKRSLLSGNDVKFPTSRGSEDIGFHLKALVVARTFSSIPQPLYLRRISEGSTSQNITLAFCHQIFDIIDEVLDFAEKNSLDDETTQQLEAAILRLLLCARIGCAGRLNSRKDRLIMIDKTISYIDFHFPERRRNPFLKGALGIYMRTACRPLVLLAMPFLKLKQEAYFSH